MAVGGRTKPTTKKRHRSQVRVTMKTPPPDGKTLNRKCMFGLTRSLDRHANKRLALYLSRSAGAYFNRATVYCYFQTANTWPPHEWAKTITNMSCFVLHHNIRTDRVLNISYRGLTIEAYSTVNRQVLVKFLYLCWDFLRRMPPYASVAIGVSKNFAGWRKKGKKDIKNHSNARSKISVWNQSSQTLINPLSGFPF